MGESRSRMEAGGALKDCVGKGEDISSLSFVDEKFGWCLVSGNGNPELLRTVDGAKTWVSQN